MTNGPDLISEDVYDNIIHLEAIIRLLEAKGLMTEQEVLDEVKKIKAMLVDKRKAN